MMLLEKEGMFAIGNKLEGLQNALYSFEMEDTSSFQLHRASNQPAVMSHHKRKADDESDNTPPSLSIENRDLPSPGKQRTSRGSPDRTNSSASRPLPVPQLIETPSVMDQRVAIRQQRLVSSDCAIGCPASADDIRNMSKTIMTC